MTILRIRVFLVVFIAFTGKAFGQIWFEDFNLPDGTINDPTPPSIWSRDISGAILGPNDYFEVRSGQMEAKNVDGEVIWYSETINISANTDVAISLLVSENGRMEETDYLRAYYILDGNEVLFGEAVGQLPGGGPVSLSVAGLNGTNLSIVVRIANDGNNEVWRFDDVTVSEPAAIYSIASGNWSDLTNWSFTPEGAPCNCTPTLLTQVEIEGGDIINYDVTTGVIGLRISGSAQLVWAGAGGSMTVNGGGTIEIVDGSSISDNGNLSADIIFSAGGSLINNSIGGLSIHNLELLGSSTFTLSGNGGLNLTNSLILGGSDLSSVNDMLSTVAVSEVITFRAATLNSTFTNNGVITIGNDFLFNNQNCELINNGTISIVDDIVVNNNSDADNTVTNNLSAELSFDQLRLGNASGFTLNNSGTFTILDDILAAVVGNQINNLTNGIINYGGTNPDAQLNLDASGIGNLINFNGTGNIIVPNPVSGYYHLEIGGGGTKTFGGATSIAGDLTISSELDMSGFDLNLAGDLINTGIITTGTNTITFDGAAQNITSGASSLYNVVIAGTGSKFLQDDFKAISNVTISSTLDPVSSGRTINIGGNFQNNGSIINNNEIIEFDGVANQSFGGSSSSTISNINVNKTGGGLSIDSQVDLLGTLEVISATAVDLDGAGAGTFKLVSNSSNDARIATLGSGASLSGNMIFEKYFAGAGFKYWRHIGSSVVGATVADLQAEIPISGTFPESDNGTGEIPSNAYPSLYYYDPAAGLASETLDDRWVVYPSSTNTETLTGTGTEARGYAIWVRETGEITFDLTGPANFGTIDYNLSGANEGWNLIGNPYPSDIDWDNPGWTKTNIQGNAIHIWDGMNYRTWNGTVGDIDEGLIAKGQGFWVQEVTNTSPQLISTESVKTGTAATTYRTVVETAAQAFIEITLGTGSYTDKTYIQFNDKAEAGFDKYDAGKLKNSIFDLSTLSRDSISLSINQMKTVICETSVPVKIERAWAGEYFLIYNIADPLHSSYTFKVIDNYSGQETSIDIDNPKIYFSINSESESAASDRFELLITPKSLNDDLDITTEQICEREMAALVQMSTSQLNAEYHVMVNGELVDIISGTGSPMELFVDDVLELGANTIQIEAVRLGCIEESIEYIEAINIISKPILDYNEELNILAAIDHAVGHWYRDNELISEIPTSYITPDKFFGAIYELEVSNESCSKRSEEFLITGIELHSLSDKIAISPNPATDFIRLKYDGKVDKVIVTDIIGKVYSREDILPEQLNVSSYDPGVYLVTIYSEGEKHTQRFIKQ